MLLHVGGKYYPRHFLFCLQRICAFGDHIELGPGFRNVEKSADVHFLKNGIIFSQFGQLRFHFLFEYVVGSPFIKFILLWLTSWVIPAIK